MADGLFLTLTSIFSKCNRGKANLQLSKRIYRKVRMSLAYRGQSGNINEESRSEIDVQSTGGKAL
jgi:hypothetical protein